MFKTSNKSIKFLFLLFNILFTVIIINGNDLNNINEGDETEGEESDKLYLKCTINGCVLSNNNQNNNYDNINTNNNNNNNDNDLINVQHFKCDGNECETALVIGDNNHCYKCHQETGCLEIFKRIKDQSLNAEICARFYGEFFKNKKKQHYFN
jgi:hypothetical protein